MRALLGFLLASSFALVVAACGGSSETEDGAGGTGASGGSAGRGGASGSGGSSGGTTGGSGGTAGAVEPPPDFTSCNVTSDCVLAQETCCVCGVPELDDLTAVNAASMAEYQELVCAGGPACLCPTALNPNLFATCDAGTCRAFDIRRHEASSCTNDDDCRVRTRSCCECGGDTGPGSLIAVAGGAGFDALVCDPLTACPECAPSYPAEATVSCDGDHCALTDTRL